MRKTVLLVIVTLLTIVARSQNPESALQQMLKDKQFNNSDVSLIVYDPENNKKLFGYRENKLIRPASVEKLITTIVALDKLGNEYTFDTELREELWSNEEGAIHRNLYLKGGLDPLFSESDFISMVDAATGKAFVDTLFVDCTLMDSMFWGPGWSWDDTPYSFIPYVSPLIINGGCVDIRVQPREKGEIPEVICSPHSSFYRIINEAFSREEKGKKLTILREWMDNSNDIRVKGNCTSTTTERMNLYRSDIFFLHLLRERLQERGVSVNTIYRKQSNDTLPSLYISKRAIGDVAKKALEESDNLCAEAMFLHLGLLSGKRPATWSDASKIVGDFIDINTNCGDKYNIADGSGLSLYNYVSAETLSQLLIYAFKTPTVYHHLMQGLPISGRTGTLKGRMIKSSAEGRIHAKTGSVKGVSTLAGYAKTKDGKSLLFVICNQGVMEQRVARQWQDKVCEILCR